MSLKAVIFDIDGTLIDSNNQHTAAWVETLRRFGLGASFQDVRAQIGKGGDQLLPVFLDPDRNAREGEAIATACTELFTRDYVSTLRAFPGVRALFERLRAEGRRVVLGTSGSKDEAERYAKIAGIADLIDDMTSSDDAEHSKPYPDIFLAALQKLKPIEPEDVLVIGDTPYDAEAAAKAGVRSIGLRCGGFSDQSLTSAGCMAIYDGPWDLLAQYESSPLRS